jgi:hypothetical protein
MVYECSGKVMAGKRSMCAQAGVEGRAAGCDLRKGGGRSLALALVLLQTHLRLLADRELRLSSCHSRSRGSISQSAVCPFPNQ